MKTNQTLLDQFRNHFLRIRFQIYQNVFPKRLKDKSHCLKVGRVCTFTDEFARNSWSGAPQDKRWDVGEAWGMYHPDKPNTYFGPPDPDSLGESVAIFTAKYNPKYFEDRELTIPYETTLLSTQKTFRQQYGRFECRCTLPQEKAVWPAFWLYGPTWPPEIDIFECLGRNTGESANTQEINLHYGRVEEGNKMCMGAWKIPLKKKGFHEFALEWTPKRLDFYTDGIRVFTYSNQQVLDKWFNTPDGRMWIILNHGLGPNYMKDNEEDFFSFFFVDYVRVYSDKPVINDLNLL